MEAHWGHMKSKPKTLDSTLNQWWIGSGWINAPMPLPMSWNNCVYQGDHKGKSAVAKAVTFLITHILLVSFPFLSHLSTPYMCFPRITSKINHFHANACLTVCYWGNPNYDTYEEHPFNYENYIHSLEPMEILINIINPGLSNTVTLFT